MAFDDLPSDRPDLFRWADEVCREAARLCAASVERLHLTEDDSRRLRAGGPGGPRVRPDADE